MSLPFPCLALSHLELFVTDVVAMTAFYTDILGFAVTDRGEGAHGMVFLSRNPDEHHQLVLNPRREGRGPGSPVDHISFRVASLGELRYFHHALAAAGVAFDAVSHGNAWSIYFRDPEGNRFEIFTDTPWHVDQPCKFTVDLSLSDEALHAYTEMAIRSRAGFRQLAEWREQHHVSLNS